MTDDATAQVLRLAHLLSTDVSEIAFLGEVDAQSLRELHGLIADVLFDTEGKGLGTLQGAAKALPPQITAKVAEKALGPVLCGRIAGSVDPALAVSISKRLPNAFLADVAGHVHPDQVQAIVSRLPSSQVLAAADVLVNRGDLVALGHFSSIIKESTLQTLVASLDDATLLDIAPFIEPIERTSQVISLIEDPNLISILRSAHGADRWVDAFDLVVRLDVPIRTRIASLVVPEAELIDGALRSAAEHDRWASLLEFTVHAKGVPERHWSDIDAFYDKDLMEACFDAAERDGLWGQVALLLSLWPEDLRKQLAKMVNAKTRKKLHL